MPATPVFTLTQDASTVFVRIQVPYVRVGALETHVDGRDFSFYCKPYLLRLRLPRACVDSGERPAKAVDDPLAPLINDVADLNRELPNAVSTMREWFRTYKLSEGQGTSNFTIFFFFSPVFLIKPPPSLILLGSVSVLNLST